MKMDRDNLFIAIAGNIGTGKTTLTKYLAERFSWAPYFEAVTNNPYLSDFYSNMPRWSFPLQIFFLGHRYRTHKSILTLSQSSIQDRCIYEDANIFARNLYESGMMEERDFNTYIDMYEQMIENLEPPHLLVFLRKNLDTLKKQIKQRGRDYEQAIPDDYLAKLNQFYDDWIKNYKHKCLVIESDDLDFVKNPEDFDYICKQITDALPQKQLFAPTALNSSLFDISAH